jgi:hypothetical protein
MSPDSNLPPYEDDDVQVNTQPTDEFITKLSELSDEQVEAMTDDDIIAYAEKGILPEPKQPVEEPPTNEEEPEIPDTKVEDVQVAEEVKEEKEPVKEATTEKEEPSSKQEETPDYEAVYKEIFKGFKANGKEITPKSVDDVISLMQMGANFTKKMQALAPMRKIYESLNKAEVKEEDLNFLIDIHKGDKEAIKKLLVKNNIEPLDIDLKETNYTPKNHMLSDSDVEFLEAVEEVQPSAAKIHDIFTNSWDAISKKTVLYNKPLLIGLHQDIQDGTFDKVQNILDQERVFGRYLGVSDVDAYADIYRKMNLESSNTRNGTVGTKKETPQQTAQREAVRKSVAPTATRSAPRKTSLTIQDLVNMPESEFLKLTERDLV